MPRFTNFILIFFIVCSVSFGQLNPGNLFNKANDYYQEENYQQAIEVYNEILDMGYVSSSLFYNLGNAHYRLGDLGYAILYYEKGLKLEPNDEDLKYNLKIVKARTIDQIKEVPQIFLIEWWELLLTSFTTSGWAIILITFYILFLISIGLYFLVKSLSVQRTAFFSGIILLAFTLVSVVLFISKVDRDSSADYGVVLEKEIAAKLSPDSKSNDAFVIHEGLKFEIRDQLNDWVQIKLSDGKVGWLPKSSMDSI
ncbi:MAG: tetratricopeptide repeat protein [Melioribacteraceae bacterium]|nr:tetratricopeptide repeat protein [Melioribacteraceae bacterium]MCF8355118.1 tetratricopeptide repeat protein [Melioribacteraceae bacterium]MCF8392405.1 tetratricopeptide repeat protein [Melioribacteraceae bacterium]MCF8417926.1 tetratricopeptide repeat protein [Melioribacteraceae bacterium]